MLLNLMTGGWCGSCWQEVATGALSGLEAVWQRRWLGALSGLTAGRWRRRCQRWSATCYSALRLGGNVTPVDRRRCPARYLALRLGGGSAGSDG